MNLKMYSKALNVRMSGSQGSPWLAWSTYCVSTEISFLQDGDTCGQGSAGFPAAAEQPSGLPLTHATLPARCSPHSVPVPPRACHPSPIPPCATAAEYALVGKRGTEVLADVGLQDSVEMLELLVGHQPHDENLEGAGSGYGSVWAAGCPGTAGCPQPQPEWH